MRHPVGVRPVVRSAGPLAKVNHPAIRVVRDSKRSVEPVVQELSPRQLAAVGSEAQTARGFIQHGVIALTALDAGNDFRQLPMQLLSIGIERFLKTTIALAELEQSGLLPRDLKKHKHDLESLPPRLIGSIGKDSAYATKWSADLSFLATDSELQRLLRALTVYGEQGRYFNLETILGSATPPKDPESVWCELEKVCLNAMPHWQAKLASPTNEFEGFYIDMATRLTATVQGCARALSRMWALGPLGQPGKQFTGVVQPFLCLTDGELSTPTKLS